MTTETHRLLFEAAASAIGDGIVWPASSSFAEARAKCRAHHAAKAASPAGQDQDTPATVGPNH